MKTSSCLATASLALLLAAGSARALEIIHPSGVSSSTSPTDFFLAAHLVDGSGLSLTPTPSSLGTHAAVSPSNAWVTQAYLPDYYAGPGALPAPVLTFTLPSAKLVSELVIWGYGNKNEAKDFEVTFSTDGTTYGDTETVTSPALLSENALRLPFPGGTHLATHVRVTVTDNFYDGGEGGGDRVGLGEVRFIGPSTVTNTDDTGAGSLRQAIADADPGDLIVFDTALSGQTITLGGSEIVLDKDITIDASALGTDISISGHGDLVPNDMRDPGESRIFSIPSDHVVTLRSLRLIHGQASIADSSGGAISSSGQLTMERCVVEDCHAPNGGGISSDHILNLVESTISGNSAIDFGGGVYAWGTMSATRSTFSGNSAATGGGIISYETLNLSQSTLSGNSAVDLAGGGLVNAGAATLIQCTVSGNSAMANGGGIFNLNAFSDPSFGITNLFNCIVSANTSPAGADISNTDGTIIVNGSNLIQSVTNEGSGTVTGPGSTLSNAPLLAPLGNYGGPTSTMPPLPGSPATNAAIGFPGAVDQRGLPIGTWSWENDFSAADLKGATVFTAGGNPATGTIDNASFRLTPKAQVQQGTLVLPDPGAFTTFAASFELFYSDATATGFSGPADGISFSFGPDPGGVVGEGGVTGSHRIVFNNYGNNTPTGTISYVDPAGTTVDTVDFQRQDASNINQWLKFTVTLDATNRLRVTFKGAVIFDVPNIGYTYAAGHRFTFGARTGTDVSEQRVDQIGIVTDPAGGAPDIGAVETNTEIPGGTVVTSTTDTVDGFDVNGVSLREAIAFAPLGGTITFDPALSGQTITLGGSQLMLHQNITIDATALGTAVSISGHGDLVPNDVRDPGESRIFEIPGGKVVLLRGLNLIHGQGTDSIQALDAWGGAISNSGQLTMERCVVADCRARFGGGIDVKGGSSLTLTQCTLSGNYALNVGGGIVTDGTTTVNDSTFSGNVATFGGGLYNSGTLNMTQCTLSENFADTWGGAISNQSPANLMLCTISGNSAVSKGGGIYNSAGTPVLANNIIAANTAPVGADIANLNAMIIVNEINLIQSVTHEGGGFFAGPGNLNAASPKLAPLGDYGGPTATMPPLPGSPAIDAVLTSLTTDQRGFPRSVDGNGDTHSKSDAGAAEYTPALDLAAFWELDFDGDGSAFGVEHALATNPLVSDPAAPGNLTSPVFNASGHATFTFGRNPAAGPHTRWVLKRSPDLSPGSFVEIFRFDGPTATPTDQPGITSIPGANSISVTDTTPPPGKAFYRFEAIHVP